MRMLARIAVAPLALLAPVAVASQPSPADTVATAIAFAPPTGRRMRYEVTQLREGEGGKERYTLIRDVEFAPAADGYAMTVTLTEANTDAPGGQGERYRVAMAAMMGVSIGYRLDRLGQVRSVENVDGVWQRLPAVRDAQIAASGDDRARATMISRVFDGLIAVPPAAREQMLRDDAARLLAFAGTEPTLATPITQARENPSPFGGTIPVSTTSGWISADADIAQFRAVTRSGGDALRLRIATLARDLAAKADPAERAKLERDLAGLSALSFEETVDYRVSRHWGVLVGSRSIKRVMSSKGEQVIEEIRTFGDWVS